MIRPATAFPLSGGLKRPRLKSPKHLDFIRELPCILTGGEAEAAHIRFGSLGHGKRETGAGEKPDDAWTVPLCPRLHRLDTRSQHSMSERRFWQEHRVDPLYIAALLWLATGDAERGRLICMNAQLIAPWRGV